MAKATIYLVWYSDGDPFAAPTKAEAMEAARAEDRVEKVTTRDMPLRHLAVALLNEPVENWRADVEVIQEGGLAEREGEDFLDLDEVPANLW